MLQNYVSSRKFYMMTGIYVKYYKLVFDNLTWTTFPQGWQFMYLLVEKLAPVYDMQLIGLLLVEIIIKYSEPQE